MKKRLRLMPILMAIMMVFTMMPMMSQTVYADDPVYTVTIDPGDGSGTPITVTSETVYTWQEARAREEEAIYDLTQGCFFNAYDTGNLEYKLPLQCGFTAPQGKEFDGWQTKGGNTDSPGLECVLSRIFDDGSTNATITAQWKIDPNDIYNYEVSFDDKYLVEDDDPVTPYTEFFYDVPAGVVPKLTVAKGEITLGSECYKASYSEVYFNEEKHEYNKIDENDWQDSFPTKPGIYFCKVEGKDPYYGSFEWIPLIRIIDLKDIGNYEVSIDNKYLVEDDDPVTPYTEFFYDVPAGVVPKLTVAKGEITLGSECYKASYSEVYFNKEKYEYNIIDENDWQNSFPTKPGIYFCKVEGVDPYYGSFEWIPLIRITSDISKDKVELSKASFVYNGKVQKPSVKTVGGKTLKEGTDYTVSWSNASSKNAGTYTVTVEGKGIYKGTTKATYTITKAANPLTIKAKTATVKGSTKGKKGKLKKNKTLAVSKVIAFTKKGQGKMTYTKSSGNKKITINKTTGKVTVKKGLKKGTYKVKVRVKAAGNTNYKASAWKTVTFKVKVK